jgi:NAD(P)H dehydrogenase (quinone)
MKKLLLISAHPDVNSYNHALANAFLSGINRSIWQVDALHLGELQFNPILKHGYNKRTEHEPDLVKALALIQQADHLVWFFPMWWYGVPALLKGFIDRVFLPGIAFEYEGKNPLPKKLWIGKSAHVIITADTPRWYDYLFMGSPAIRQFKKGTLQFCGINPVKVTYIAPLRNSTNEFRVQWIEKVKYLAQQTK